MIKYFKNFILCGDADYFCLLCEESFEGAEDVEKHIRWEQHRKLIKTSNPSPKFRKDGIYKVTNGYYCEFCNYITSTMDAVKDHIKVESHIGNKTNPEIVAKDVIIKRDNGLVRVSDLVINKKEWHGIVNNQCLFCNTSVGNFDQHRTSASHMINYIQAKVITEKDGWIYRKINSDTYYCFKCKKTLYEQYLADHSNSDSHSTNNIINNNNNNKEETKNFQKLFDIDRGNSMATCVLCKKNIIWSLCPLKTHANEHIKNKEWELNEFEMEKIFLDLHVFNDKGQSRALMKAYGKDNYIKLNEGGSKGYCSLCHTYISAHIRNFQQHVDGLRHTSHLELKGLKKKSKKTERPRFKSKSVKQLFGENDIIFIHNLNKYFVVGALSIELKSFVMMDNPESFNGKFICYLCDEMCLSMHAHLLTDHKTKLLNTPVLTSVEGEFVREIKPGLYHCGICNVPFAGWASLQKHFKLFTHKFAKIDAMTTVKDVAEYSINDVRRCNCSKCNYMRFQC